MHRQCAPHRSHSGRRCRTLITLRRGLMCIPYGIRRPLFIGGIAMVRHEAAGRSRQRRMTGQENACVLHGMCQGQVRLLTERCIGSTSGEGRYKPSQRSRKQYPVKCSESQVLQGAVLTCPRRMYYATAGKTRVQGFSATAHAIGNAALPRIHHTREVAAHSLTRPRDHTGCTVSADCLTAASLP